MPDIEGGDEASTNISDNEKHTHTEEIIPAVEPTCTKRGYTEGIICSECGEVIKEQEVIPALGHTTDVGTCERCGRSFGIWVTDYYVDEFIQPTDDWYIVNDKRVRGLFSNSITTNSHLSAEILFDCDNDIAFVLYEYGSYQVKGIWDIETYSIIMRTSDGTDHNMKGYLYENSDRIHLDSIYVDDVVTALSGEGQVSFYMQSEKYKTTSYLFTIDASNFADVYNSKMND